MITYCDGKFLNVLIFETLDIYILVIFETTCKNSFISFFFYWSLSIFVFSLFKARTSWQLVPSSIYNHPLSRFFAIVNISIKLPPLFILYFFYFLVTFSLYSVDRYNSHPLVLSEGFFHLLLSFFKARVFLYVAVLVFSDVFF